MNSLLLRDARMLVRTFMGITADDSVLVVCDDRRLQEAAAVKIAVEELGASPLMANIDHFVAELLTSDEFWIDPPAALIAAMQATTVNIMVVDETYGFRLDHKVRQLFETGEHCSIFKVDLGMGEWNLSPRDVDVSAAAGARILERLATSETVRIRSAAGTDVKLRLGGRDCLVVPTIPERGMPYAIPIPLWGEYNWAPILESVEGTVVVDGITEATTRIHVVDAPVVWRVEGGRIVEVSGGMDAEHFRRIFATDDSSDKIGELGVGANPKAIPGTETEKALLGTVHFGVGQNDEYPGGDVRSQVHVDGVVRAATIEVDGVTVMDAGRLA